MLKTKFSLLLPITPPHLTLSVISGPSAPGPGTTCGSILNLGQELELAGAALAAAPAQLSPVVSGEGRARPSVAHSRREISNMKLNSS